MTDLEKSINPITDNSENTNSEIIQNNTFNSWETEVTGNDFNIPENTINNWVLPENPEQNTIQTNPQLNTSEIEMWNNNQSVENLNSIEENKTINNEIILWKYENTMINTTETPQNSYELDNPLLENSIVLENTPTEDTNKEEQQKNNKLADDLQKTIRDPKDRTKLLNKKMEKNRKKN